MHIAYFSDNYMAAQRTIILFPKVRHFSLWQLPLRLGLAEGSVWELKGRRILDRKRVTSWQGRGFSQYSTNYHRL